MDAHVSLSILLSAVVLVRGDRPGETVTIECEGSSRASHFTRVHALDLLYGNVSQLSVTEDGNVAVTRIATLKVGDRRGVLSREIAVIRATLHDFDCSTFDDLQCELFGLVIADGRTKIETKKRWFKPKILHESKSQDEVDISLTHMKDSIHVVCSAHADPTDNDWGWQVLVPGGNHFQTLPQEHQGVKQTKFKRCVPYTTSEVIYPTRDAGDVTLKCHLGHRGVGSVTISVDSRDINDETLGTMLTISTTVLVYTHFILLPVVFSRWNHVFTYRILRNSEDFFMRKMRTAISYIIGIVFFVICLTLCIACWTHALVASYLTFSIIEFIFIMGYATMRFLSNKSLTDTTNQDRLRNARIVTSFGAVITPIICWLIIRINGGVCNIVLETLFYVFTAASVLGFVFASFDREGQYWDKRS